MSYLSLLLRWFSWLSSPREQGPEPSLAPNSWVTSNRLSLSLKFCICRLERACCLPGGVRLQWDDVYKASTVLHTQSVVPSPPSSSLALFHPQLPVSCLFPLYLIPPPPCSIWPEMGLGNEVVLFLCLMAWNFAALWIELCRGCYILHLYVWCICRHGYVYIYIFKTQWLWEQLLRSTFLVKSHCKNASWRFPVEQSVLWPQVVRGLP